MSWKSKRTNVKKMLTLSSAVLATVSALPFSLISGTVESYATELKTEKVDKDSSSKQKQKPQYRNVMYYGDWSIWGGQGNFYPKNMPADQYTHINFAFLDMDSNGDLLLTDPDAAFGHPVGSENGWNSAVSGVVPALVALREQNPNVKIGVSLGGWSKSGDFTGVTADPAKRANFVNNVMKFIEYTGMDFVDVDWEFPTSVR